MSAESYVKEIDSLRKEINRMNEQLENYVSKKI